MINPGPETADTTFHFEREKNSRNKGAVTNLQLQFQIIFYRFCPFRSSLTLDSRCHGACRTFFPHPATYPHSAYRQCFRLMNMHHASRYASNGNIALTVAALPVTANALNCCRIKDLYSTLETCSYPPPTRPHLMKNNTHFGHRPDTSDIYGIPHLQSRRRKPSHKILCYNRKRVKVPLQVIPPRQQPLLELMLATETFS